MSPDHVGSLWVRLRGSRYGRTLHGCAVVGGGGGLSICDDRPIGPLVALLGIVVQSPLCGGRGDCRFPSTVPPKKGEAPLQGDVCPTTMRSKASPPPPNYAMNIASAAVVFLVGLPQFG